MPLVLEDSVGTFLSTSPVFQSRRYAMSVTCSPTQRPSGVASRAFGCPSGDLKSLVMVVALRIGTRPFAWSEAAASMDETNARRFTDYRQYHTCCGRSSTILAYRCWPLA